MGKIQVKRVTLIADETNEIEFDFQCGKYLIKNFSEDDIYVSFDETFDHDNSIKIQADHFQIVVANEWLGGLDAYKTNTLYIEGTGEIEVQQLCFN